MRIRERRERLYSRLNYRDFSPRTVAGLAARGARAGGCEIGKTSRMYASRNAQKSLACQSAFNIDPVSASNFDPLERRVLAVALAPSELVGVAETARARVV
jgi:hypothetical protein